MTSVTGEIATNDRVAHSLTRTAQGLNGLIDRNAWVRQNTDPTPIRIRPRQEHGLSGQIEAIKTVKNRDINQFCRDVEGLCGQFNALSRAEGLGVTLDAAALVRKIRSGNHKAVQAYFDLSGMGGRVYDNQMDTFGRVHKSLLTNATNTHVILGAMQSGKTGSAILLMLHTAIFYAMTGIALSPLYLLPNSKSQENQMGLELDRFLTFYGDVEIQFDRAAFTALPFMACSEWEALGVTPALSLVSPSLDATFQAEPTLRTYLTDVLQVETASDLIIRRGRSLASLEREMARMTANHLIPMPVLDEVQYGASSSEKTSCMTQRIMDVINCITVQGRKPRYVATSATPFAETTPVNIRVVMQTLPEDYCGIVYFKQQPFPGHEKATPLKIKSLSEIAKSDRMPTVKHIHMTHYKAARKGSLKISDFRVWAQRVGYHVGGFNQTPAAICSAYAEHVEMAMQKFLIRLVNVNRGRADNGNKRGICVRLSNSNESAADLLYRLDLDPEKVEIVTYFGNVEGQSIRQILSQRARPDLPFIVAVTARARYGDSFSRDVDTFVDFGNGNADYNALLQGFVGRGMGAGKSSTVILSDASTKMVRDYIASNGLMTKTATRHGVLMGERQRVRQTPSFRIQRGINTRLDQLIDTIDATIVANGIRTTKNGPAFDKQGINRLYGWDTKKHIPIMALLRQYGVDEMIATNPGLVLKGYKGETRLARVGDKVLQKDGSHRSIIAHPNDADFTYVALRSYDVVGGRGERADVARKGRKAHGNDIARKSNRIKDQLYPTLVLKLVGDRYKLVHIDLPLVAPVQIGGQGVSEVAPVERHIMFNEMSAGQKLAYGYGKTSDLMSLHQRAAALKQAARAEGRIR